MLIDGRNFWKLHGRWAIFTLLAALAATAWTWWVGRATGRWPGGGSLSGLALGGIAALIFIFELALVARKTKALRTARWLLSAQVWMKAHIWLGLLTVPLVVLHSGGRTGSWMTLTLVVVFTVVIASGLWGLALQNVLPKLLLEVAPAETVYAEIDRVGLQYAEQARQLMVLACGTDAETQRLGRAGERVPSLAATGAPRRVGLQPDRKPYASSEQTRTLRSPTIESALAGEIAPYLQTGAAANQLLGTHQRNQWYFEDLRLRVAPELRTLVDQLESLCEQRRQLSMQRRLHFWLHSWLALHLPLSLALLVLMVAHVFFALRFG